MQRFGGALGNRTKAAEGTTVEGAGLRSQAAIESAIEGAFLVSDAMIKRSMPLLAAGQR